MTGLLAVPIEQGVASGGVVAQFGVADDVLIDVVRILGLVATAGVVALLVGIVYRWYANQRVPDGLSMLVALSVVALYLNTAGALGDVIGGEDDLLALEAAVFNVVTFVVAALAASAGGRLGDRICGNLFALSGGMTVDRDVSRLIRSVGRVTVVDLPDEIDDMEGYDPVDEAVKEKLTGHRLSFPRRLTVEELRSRLVERLKTDYGVGHVDVDLADDGTVEYMALGGHESGIGPTLPPGSAAVAVRADPANRASPGDTVQLWTAGDSGDGTEPSHVLNAELRGAVDDVVTLAVDEAEAIKLDTDRRYRIVTLPVGPRIDREFASQLRAAEETTGVATIDEGSSLAGAIVGALDLAVVGVRSPDGGLEAIPPRNRVLSPGETVYAIGRPDRLRKLEAAAGTAPTTGEG